MNENIPEERKAKSSPSNRQALKIPRFTPPTGTEFFDASGKMHPLLRAFAQANLDTGLSVRKSIIATGVPPEIGKQYDDRTAHQLTASLQNGKGLPLRERYRSQFIEKGYTLAFKLLRAASNDDKIEEASLRDIVYALSAIMDRVLVASGRFEEKDFQNFHPIQAMADEQLDEFIVEAQSTLKMVKKEVTTTVKLRG